MTQEEKQLLLIDLCGRLPYEVKVNLHNEIYTLLGYYDDYIMLTANVPTGQQTNIVNIKPYLRPMSSMTEEEENEFLQINFTGNDSDIYGKLLNVPYADEVINWLNAHHFDHRCLIKKGLALEAPEGMYKND